MHTLRPQLTDLYFALLGRGLHPGMPPATEEAEAAAGRMWQEVYELAVRQGTTALVLDGVGTLLPAVQPARELRIRWAVQVEAIANRYRRQSGAAASAARLFAGNGIRMLVLKGIGLSADYPVPSHRECGDVDIYLFGEHDAGNRILLSAGAHLLDEVPKHTGLRWQGVHFENHRHFLNVSRNRTERALDALLCGILQTEGACIAPEGYYTPPATFNAIYLIRHAALHFLKEGISVRHLCDWSCFLERQRDAIDRDLFSDTLKRYGMERFERLLTAAAIRCCGLRETMPDHNPRLLERFIGEVLAYTPPRSEASRWMRFVDKFRTPFAHRWRFRLLGQSLWGYYRDVLRAQWRERFTLFR